MPAIETHNRRLNRPATFTEVMGGAEGQPLELNTAESAVCGRCGKEPRMYHHTSPRSRDVIVWIPADHTCSGRRQA